LPIDSATEMNYIAKEEGYYQGSIQTERNGVVYSEKIPGTQYYVTFPATIPNNNSYDIIRKDETLGNNGITDPNNKQGYLGETIVIKFTDDYKFDRMRYQWYQYNATAKSKLTPVAGACGETAEKQISFKPNASGVYVVAV
jgi:Lhr-like helicase